MEDKKKPIMIAVVVVCAVVAVGMIYKTIRSASPMRGIDSMKSAMMWVKCKEKDCNAEYQMDQKDYFRFTAENQKENGGVTPPLTCEKCGKSSVYRALKCAKCQKVFFYGFNPRTLPDKCECGFSPTEDRARAATGKK